MYKTTPLSTLTLANIIEHAVNLEVFLDSIMGIRQEEVKDFIQKEKKKKSQSQGLRGNGSKVILDFLLHFIEVPMKTIATPNRELTISLWRECHANKKWNHYIQLFHKGNRKRTWAISWIISGCHSIYDKEMDLISTIPPWAAEDHGSCLLPAGS